MPMAAIGRNTSAIALYIVHLMRKLPLAFPMSWRNDGWRQTSRIAIDTRLTAERFSLADDAQVGCKGSVHNHILGDLSHRSKIILRLPARSS